MKKRQPKALTLNKETLRTMDLQQIVGGISMAPRCSDATQVSVCVTNCPSCGPSYDPNCNTLWCPSGIC
jgi:hypothetical protein